MSNEPLWTDERLIAEAEAIGAYFDSREVGLEVRELLRQLRDDYENKLAAERAAWDELMAHIAVEGGQRP